MQQHHILALEERRHTLFQLLALPEYSYNISSEFNVDIGQISTVYGILTIKKHLWYLVARDEMEGPMYYPSHLFEIIDGRISKYWFAKEGKDQYDNNTPIIQFGFKELVDDEYFYGELLEDNPVNEEVFKLYKTSMDNEFI